jgi:hypothetical protein
MPNRKFDAFVVHTDDDATLHYNNENFVFKELKSAFEDGSKVTVEVKTRRKPRSLPANAYLHLCLGMIADETGNSLEVIKITLKGMYAKKPLLDKEGEPMYDKATGEAVMYIQDTSDMSSIEAFEFTEKVRMFAMDFCGMILPLPEENIKLILK